MAKLAVVLKSPRVVEITHDGQMAKIHKLTYKPRVACAAEDGQQTCLLIQVWICASCFGGLKLEGTRVWLQRSSRW